MRQVKLGDICRVVSGATPKRAQEKYWDGEVPWVTPKEISALNSPDLEDSLEKITQAGYKSCSTKMLPVGSLLLSSRAPIGLLAINKIEVCTNQGFKSLVPSDEVEVGYLYRYLKSNVKQLQAKGNGATFKELSKSAVENFTIALPPIDDQIRIAHLLSKVEGLISQRKESLQQLDELLKSVFLEMFGDLSKNEKAFSLTILDDVKSPSKGTFSNGPFGSDLLTKELNKKAGVPVVYIRDIRNGFFSWKSGVYVTKEKAYSLPNCNVKFDDLLIAKVGDPPGIAAINNQFPEAIITQDVIRLRVDKSKVSPAYIQGLLNSDYGAWLIKKITIKGTRSRFSLRNFKALKIPLPDPKLQYRFSGIVEKIEGVKSQYQQSLAELENLYGALSQNAFKGELDLSRIPSMASPKLVPTPPRGRKVGQKIKAHKSSSFINTNELGDPEPFNKEAFEDFLSSRKGQIITASTMWHILQKNNFTNLPEDFDEFKEFVLQYLEGGRLLEQVYDEVTEFEGDEGRQKKIALWVRNDT